LVAGSVGGTAGAVASGATIPLLAPLPERSVERDTPPAVRARIEREQRAFLVRARAASRLPVTVGNGCETFRIAGTTRVQIGPPPPRITARIIGHHVEVVFSYPRLPSSPACRPFLFEVSGYSGATASSTYSNAGSVGQYLLSGPRGRVVIDVPWNGHAPYHVVARSATIVGRRGSDVRRLLTCPGTGGAVRGCLPGYRPPLHSWPLPRPVLPIRGVDRSALEASLRYVLAGERWPKPRAARCPSLRVCNVTYVEPDFPRSPYRVRYRVAGEQIAGCWMAMRQRVIGRLPYEDAGQGRLELAACVSWLR